jgi:hypothetical protein
MLECTRGNGGDYVVCGRRVRPCSWRFGYSTIHASTFVNNWIIRTLGRSFPALVIQGDTLHLLISNLERLSQNPERALGVQSELTEKVRADSEKLTKRQLTPGQFFLKACGGKFTDEDLNGTGNAFARRICAQLFRLRAVCEAMRTP